jgi:hypothetical protein
LNNFSGRILFDAGLRVVQMVTFSVEMGTVS